MIQGLLELDTRGGGQLRRREAGYVRERNDVQVPVRLVKQYGLRAGDEIAGDAGRGRGAPELQRISTVNGVDPAALANRPDFSRLTAVHPDEMLRLEIPGKGGPVDHTTRVIDLICPFGKGQRAMIVAPAKAGKTMVLQAIAEGVKHNYPAAVLFILLVDERPEEVFEIEAAGVGEVIASSFDQPPAQHVAVAELTQERARRRVELGQDVVLIVDSLTRLARAYNSVVAGSGRTLSGGLDSQAMERPKRFFGGARFSRSSRAPGTASWS
jgi:transcription termination factor Rho